MAEPYKDTYDVVIVGAGVAGLIVAAKISQKGVNPSTGEKLRVAVLERGPYVKGDARPGYGHPVRRRMFTNITTEFREGGRYVMGVYPQGPTGPNTFAILAASIVGGGSLHYTAQTRHPHSADYRAWQNETGVDWTESAMKAASDEVIRVFNIHPRPDGLLTRFDLDFRDAGKRLNFEVSPTTVSKRNCLYSGFCDGVDMCKYDARQGSFVSYLPIAEQNGAHILADTEARRIVVDRGRATGVEFRQNNTDYVVSAGKVIVSCGILGSPSLLLRSGIGPREDLGRDLSVESPNVGRHIDGRAGPFNVDAEFDTLMSDGEFHDGGFHLFHDTTPEGLYDRIQLRSYHPDIGAPHQAALEPMAPPFGRPHKEFMRNLCNPAVPSRYRDALLKSGRVTVVVVRPGQVKGRTNARAEMVYEIDHPSLQKLFQQGAGMAEEVLRAMKATRVTRDTRPIRNVGFLAWAGSCRAGIDRATSVVNPYGECHDVENLFVCDASILPRCASQGYAGPTSTVAIFVASRIVERHFTKKG